MENASKALIIAGAILLAILLITMGIVVYRQASGVMDSSSMDEVAVTTFNQKFTQYEGDNVRGTQVNALISTVKQNNLSNSGDASKQVTLYEGENTSTTKWGETKKALTGKSYKVETKADSKSGYITSIYINQIGE